MGLFDGAIPKALQSTDNWVCSKNGNKIPFQALENHSASVSDRNTWSSFENATQSVLWQQYDGIGYVFCDNGIVGIDIDDGYDNDGFISDLALDIVTKCKSYTEMSRSGRGFHIFVKGTLPFDGKNNQHGVEIYKNKRWFITTGNKLCYDDVVENQAAIDYIVEKYFPEMRETSDSKVGNTIYTAKVERNGTTVHIEYPRIGEGGRNIRLASIAGQLHTSGFSKEFILNELLHVNKVACNPCLDEYEVCAVVNSITRYTR